MTLRYPLRAQGDEPNARCRLCQDRAPFKLTFVVGRQDACFFLSAAPTKFNLQPLELLTYIAIRPCESALTTAWVRFTTSRRLMAWSQ